MVNGIILFWRHREIIILPVASSSLRCKGSHEAFFLFQGSPAKSGIFSTTYQQGSLAPSAFPSILSGLRFPPYPSRENNGALPPVSQETISWPCPTAKSSVDAHASIPACPPLLAFLHHVSNLHHGKLDFPDFSAKHLCNVLALQRLMFLTSEHHYPFAPMLSR